MAEISLRNRRKSFSFFNKESIFKISQRSKLNNNTYLYWLKENGRKIKNRFLRQNLFALKDQIVK